MHQQTTHKDIITECMHSMSAVWWLGNNDTLQYCLTENHQRTCKNGLINTDRCWHNPNNSHICWDLVTNCVTHSRAQFTNCHNMKSRHFLKKLHNILHTSRCTKYSCETQKTFAIILLFLWSTVSFSQMLLTFSHLTIVSALAARNFGRNSVLMVLTYKYLISASKSNKGFASVGLKSLKTLQLLVFLEVRNLKYGYKNVKFVTYAMPNFTTNHALNVHDHKNYIEQNHIITKISYSWYLLRISNTGKLMAGTQ